MQSFPYAKKNVANLIGIGGIARTGKALIGGLTSTFNNSEKINVNINWELANQLRYVKQINDESAVFLLRRIFATITYNLAIGREVNTRKNEFTSIFSNKKPSTYLSRIKNVRDGDQVFKSMKRKKFYVPILIHDALVHFKIILKAFPSMKLIHLEKNPIELAYSWMNKKYGSEFYKNDRVGILTLRKGKNILPWYCFGWEKKFLSLKENDKIIYILAHLIKKQNIAYKKIKNKKNVLIIFFERFVTDPKHYIKKLEKFTKFKNTSFSKKFLKENNCPRILKKKDLEKKRKYLKEKISKNSFKKLMKLEKNYLKKLDYKEFYI